MRKINKKILENFFDEESEKLGDAIENLEKVLRKNNMGNVIKKARKSCLELMPKLMAEFEKINSNS